MIRFILVVALTFACSPVRAGQPSVDSQKDSPSDYAWTTDHMHVGVRWQPFVGRPENNAYDATRPIFTKDGSYVQFWVSWNAVERTVEHTNYAGKMSEYLQTIEAAVDACVAEGLKVEFVFFFCPSWASVSGKQGGWKPKPDHYSAFVTRIARRFKGRVHAYQLYHEANLKGYLQDGDIDYLISEIFIKGSRAIRNVYNAEPAKPVIVSTSGCSPCVPCHTLDGLRALGGLGVNNFYDHLIANTELMELVDALNLNVTDHSNGYGKMDDTYVPSTWGNYDLVRRKLDIADYRGKRILASESWITWDDGYHSRDVNGDGVKNEQDAYIKAVTIMGQCLERGLNTMNFPWSDNSSGWAMGLTKRRDYNGRIKSLQPEIVVGANDGGPDIVTKKIALHGRDANFKIADASEPIFTVEDYINPSDPNHLHYYVWKWYAQVAGGSDEVIRHAMVGEENNDIVVTGPGYVGDERYRISSYNRTKDRFTVLIYADRADGTSEATVSIPSRIRNGHYYNNEFSISDFRGEGIVDGESYHARIVTKDISMTDGQDVNPVITETDGLTVSNETLTVTVPKMNKFTTIEFIKGG